MTEQRPQPAVTERPENGFRSYYAKAVIKEPTWTWEVPWYLFLGGLSGASSLLSLAARLRGDEELARRALWVALGGATVSPVLLILDLGRPERFYNMLRVFKPTSPMSLGTWILSAFGALTGAAVVCDLFDVFPRLRVLLEGGSALLGPPLATYTAVLITDTSVPVWHEARRELPFVFAASAAASAGGAAMLVNPTKDVPVARRLAVGGGLLEVVGSELMKRRLGELLSEPYRKEKAGRYEKLSVVLSVAGVTTVGLLGQKSRTASLVGGAAVLAGAVLKRWSVFEAGFQSARDPRYTVMPQRERLRRRTDAS